MVLKFGVWGVGFPGSTKRPTSITECDFGVKRESGCYWCAMLASDVRAVSNVVYGFLSLGRPPCPLSLPRPLSLVYAFVCVCVDG